MSWHYSQALVAESSADYSLDGERSAPWKLMNMLAPSSLQDKTTDASNPSQSGMTLRHSTDAHGEVSLTWYQGDSLVKTYQRPGATAELVDNVLDFGEKWQELSVKFNPDTFWWKTHRSLFPEDLMLCSLILPRWGSMQDGQLSGRIPVDFHTTEPAYGWWPTPTCWEEKYVRSPSPGDHYHGIGWLLANTYKIQPSPKPYQMLMDWPCGWTRLEPLATGKFQQWLDSHGIS